MFNILTMKNIIFFLLILIKLSTLAQKSKLKKNYIYFVCRSTKYKNEIIAKDFNIKDTIITHIGLGIYLNNELSIYNVSTNKKNNDSFLIKENLNEFISVKDIEYYSIYSKKSNHKDIRKILNEIKEILGYKIEFDTDFDLSNGARKLYCSEFVYYVLKKSNTIDYNPIHSKKLKGLYKNIFGNELEYIPVDFFKLDKTVKLLHETYF